MNTNKAVLTVVDSTRGLGLSLRGPKGRGQNDPFPQHLEAAGFKDGDRVVMVTEEYFNDLLKRAGVNEG